MQRRKLSSTKDGGRNVMRFCSRQVTRCDDGRTRIVDVFYHPLTRVTFERRTYKRRGKKYRSSEVDCHWLCSYIAPGYNTLGYWMKQVREEQRSIAVDNELHLMRLVKAGIVKPKPVPRDPVILDMMATHILNEELKKQAADSAS